MKDSEDYLIWSNEHRSWWGHARRGYSKGIKDAGRYSREQAIDICRSDIPQASHVGLIAEVPVREADLFEFLEGQMLPSAIVRGWD